jgi:hypothetical protein
MIEPPAMQPQMAVNRERCDPIGASGGGGEPLYLPAGKGKGESSHLGSKDTALS